VRRLEVALAQWRAHWETARGAVALERLRASRRAVAAGIARWEAGAARRLVGALSRWRAWVGFNLRETEFGIWDAAGENSARERSPRSVRAGRSALRAWRSEALRLARDGMPQRPARALFSGRATGLDAGLDAVDRPRSESGGTESGGIVDWWDCPPPAASPRRAARRPSTVSASLPPRPRLLAATFSRWRRKALRRIGPPLSSKTMDLATPRPAARNRDRAGGVAGKENDRTVYAWAVEMPGKRSCERRPFSAVGRRVMVPH
jgi:hypothetical protein